MKSGFLFLRWADFATLFGAVLFLSIGSVSEAGEPDRDVLRSKKKPPLEELPLAQAVLERDGLSFLTSWNFLTPKDKRAVFNLVETGTGNNLLHLMADASRESPLTFHLRAVDVFHEVVSDNWRGLYKKRPDKALQILTAKNSAGKTPRDFVGDDILRRILSDGEERLFSSSKRMIEKDMSAGTSMALIFAGAAGVTGFHIGAGEEKNPLVAVGGSVLSAGLLGLSLNRRRAAWTGLRRLALREARRSK